MAELPEESEPRSGRHGHRKNLNWPSRQGAAGTPLDGEFNVAIIE